MASDRTRFELIIFDCDGVLVDSERITNTVFAKMLQDLGLPVDLDYMFEHFMGESMKKCMSRVEDMLGKPPPDDFIARYYEETAAASRAQLQAVDGIQEVLNQLVIPICVASNGVRAEIRNSLSITRLLPKFEGRMFSSQDVERGKPAPDVFLHAAAMMGTQPHACAVIEDTPVGVQAGVAAGMRVFGYAGLIHPGRLIAAGAHQVFQNMRELPALLAA